MQQEKYAFIRGKELYYYEFYSKGPNGNIKKIVRYSLIQQHPAEVYNLGFGDWVEDENIIDDTIISDNKDWKKILFTVADTVLNFTKLHPASFIFVQGSTGGRTRLYQMRIALFWDEISVAFIVLGLADGGWSLFEKGKNYEAFLVKKK